MSAVPFPPPPHHCPLWFSHLLIRVWVCVCHYGTPALMALPLSPPRQGTALQGQTLYHMGGQSIKLPESLPSPPARSHTSAGGLDPERTVGSPSLLPTVCWVSHLESSFRKEALGKGRGSLTGLAGATSGWDGLPERQGWERSAVSLVGTGEWTQPVTFGSSCKARRALTLSVGGRNGPCLPPLSTLPSGPHLLPTCCLHRYSPG